MCSVILARLALTPEDPMGDGTCHICEGGGCVTDFGIKIVGLPPLYRLSVPEKSRVPERINITRLETFCSRRDGKPPLAGSAWTCEIWYAV